LRLFAGEPFFGDFLPVDFDGDEVFDFFAGLPPVGFNFFLLQLY